MANKNIAKEGMATRFPHNDPTKGGRKPKIYTVLKKLGYGKDDIKTCFGELLFYNEKDLQKVHSDKTKPIITQIIAKACIQAKKSGDISKIKDMIEHTLGKPNQTIDTTIENKVIPITLKID